MKLDWTDERILENILDGNEEGLIFLYKSHRAEFVSWLQGSNKVNKEDAVDLYQDAIIVFRRNVINKSYVKGKASLRTYLFGIGKNLFFNQQRKIKKEVSFDTSEMPEPKRSKESELTDQQLKIKNLVLKLNEPCKSILRMFYYDRFSMDVIASRLGYKNTTVAKSQKVRCMKQLKQKLKA